jgi:hypothetical protein
MYLTFLQCTRVLQGKVYLWNPELEMRIIKSFRRSSNGHFTYSGGDVNDSNKSKNRYNTFILYWNSRAEVSTRNQTSRAATDLVRSSTIAATVHISQAVGDNMSLNWRDLKFLNEITFFFYLVCETIGTAATPGLLCQPRVIVRMIVESRWNVDCRL